MQLRSISPRSHAVAIAKTHPLSNRAPVCRSHALIDVGGAFVLGCFMNTINDFSPVITAVIAPIKFSANVVSVY